MVEAKQGTSGTAPCKKEFVQIHASGHLGGEGHDCQEKKKGSQTESWCQQSVRHKTAWHLLPAADSGV